MKLEDRLRTAYVPRGIHRVIPETQTLSTLDILDEAREAIYKYLDTLLGADEPETHEDCDVDGYDHCYKCDEENALLGRNQLRAELRNKLADYCGVEKGNE